MVVRQHIPPNPRHNPSIAEHLPGTSSPIAPVQVFVRIIRLSKAAWIQFTSDSGVALTRLPPPDPGDLLFMFAGWQFVE